MHGAPGGDVSTKSLPSQNCMNRARPIDTARQKRLALPRVQVHYRRRLQSQRAISFSLFDTMYSSISLRKSIPPQIRQLNILVSDSKQ